MHTKEGDELCGLEKWSFENIWEIKLEFKNTFESLAAENKMQKINYKNLKELREEEEHH